MSKQNYPQQLAETKSWRAVELLPNSLLHLHWDWTTIELRTADLIGLSQALTKWFDENETDYEHYVLKLNNYDLTLSYTELEELHQLLIRAIEQLPRRIIRWVDIVISIQPLPEKVFVPKGRFSFN